MSTVMTARVIGLTTNRKGDFIRVEFNEPDTDGKPRWITELDVPVSNISQFKIDQKLDVEFSVQQEPPCSEPTPQSK